MKNIILCILLALSGIAGAQQTNLFTNAAPNLPYFPTNANAGGLSGVFIPLALEGIGTNSTNSYLNGTNYQGASGYNSGQVFPVGLPISVNAAFGFSGWTSNTANAVSSVVATIQQSVDGQDWTTLTTLTLTTGAATAAGTLLSASTNISIGAYSLFRVSTIADVQLPGTNNLFTNMVFGVAGKNRL